MSLLEISQLCKNAQYEDALTEIESLPQELADSEEGLFLKAWCLNQLTRIHQAFLVFSQAVEKHPDSTNLRIYWLEAAFHDSQLELALKETLKTPDLLEESHSLTFDFLQAISRNGRNDLVKVAEAAISKHHSFALVSLVTGLILKSLGNFTQAKAFLEKAMQSNEDLHGINKINYVDFLGQALANRSSIEDVTQGVLGRYEHDDETAWFLYQLARRMDATGVIEQGYLETIPPAGIHFEKIPVHEHNALASKLIFEEKSKEHFVSPPTLSSVPLTNRISDLYDMVEAARAAGAFDIQLNNIAKLREQYAPDISDPTFVMSTGRCGTRSLYELLAGSDYVLQFHSFTQQMSVGDRNHILYRLLSGILDTEVIVGLAQNYLMARTAELMYAYRQGKRPVFVSHFDTIYHPINKALFPESKILYIRRDEIEVFKSFHSKNQFGSSQLMPLRFDPSFPDKVFCYSTECGMAQPERIAWYLAATRYLGEAATSAFPEDSLTCVANDLFAGDHEAITALTRFLHCPDLDEDLLRQHFSKKINAKQDRVDTTGSELERDAEVAKNALAEFGVPV